MADRPGDQLLAAGTQMPQPAPSLRSFYAVTRGRQSRSPKARLFAACDVSLLLRVGFDEHPLYAFSATIHPRSRCEGECTLGTYLNPHGRPESWRVAGRGRDRSVEVDLHVLLVAHVLVSRTGWQGRRRWRCAGAGLTALDRRPAWRPHHGGNGSSCLPGRDTVARSHVVSALGPRSVRI